MDSHGQVMRHCCTPFATAAEKAQRCDPSCEWWQESDEKETVMLSDAQLEDKVRWYRTQATNSQLGDLIRHEWELLEKANRLEVENEELRVRIAQEAPQRRRALSSLHQIYDLGIDPKNAHLSAKVRALLDEAK